MMAICAASSLYHGAQCVHGCDSEPAARWCTVDTMLAVSSSLFMATQVHVTASNAALAALSLAFFTDAFHLGYTLSHSFWHFSTAAMAVVSRPKLSAAVRSGIARGAKAGWKGVKVAFPAWRLARKAVRKAPA